ncbi:hypothetical protein GX48_08058 [Paracoccidioides brasiliensis]|nr:hypothetical protein GX48_08058 [Paracoccidioides brasiliensis]
MRNDVDGYFLNTNYSQLEDILTAFLAWGEWEQVEQDLLTRYNDPWVNQVPRLRRSVREPVHISLWPEKIYSLSVDNGPKIQVPNVVTRWDCVLMEELFDPRLDHPITKTALEARSNRIIPERLAQRNNKSPIFIPTIPQMIDALLDQDRYRHDHVRDSNFNILASQPAEHIMGFVRSLYLEHPAQQEGPPTSH